jgi:transposase
MTNTKTIARLLKIKECKLTDISFHHGNVVRLAVKPLKNGCRCVQCGRRGKIIRTRSQAREWRDLKVGGWHVHFVYAPREIFCPTHGRVEEQIPWAAPYSRITYRCEYVMLRLCQEMTQKAAAGLLGLASSTLSNLLHRSIDRHREGHRIRGIKHLGVDEISFKKGHKYATLVYDLQSSKVIWIGQGKGRKTIDEFFESQLSDYQKQQIEAACCDMSQAYVGAITEHCPNATLVIDRFHIIKALNEAVDDVRKEQWREANKEDRKLFKGMRWLLFRHSSTRTPEHTRSLRAMEKHNKRIYRAWQLKEEFEAFWEYKAPWAAERFLNKWLTRCLKSRLEPLRRFVNTVRKHMDAILAFTRTRLTNAISEGLNRVAKIVKNRASGFRNLEPFADLIMLVIGDVDIPAQIPTKFRTV